jgi:hypothetical protein
MAMGIARAGGVDRQEEEEEEKEERLSSCIDSGSSSTRRSGQGKWARGKEHGAGKLLKDAQSVA